MIEDYDILQENYKNALEKIKRDLMKCLGMKKSETEKELKLIMRPDKRDDQYDLFDFPSLPYIKGMSHDDSFTLLIECKTKSESIITTNIITVSTFRLLQFPGCCGVALSTGAHVFPKFRKKGIGTLLNKLRIEIARANGYTLLVCTAVDDGITSKILLRNGWAETIGFTNKRTKNHIIMYSIYL